MAQAIAETVFDILYLGFALITGLTMLTKGKSRIVKMAGWMTALLGGRGFLSSGTAFLCTLDNRDGSKCSRIGDWEIYYVCHDDGFLSDFILYLA